MINFKKFNFKNFIRLDLRWKLKRIGKHLGLNIYPKFFIWKGFKGLYSKFIFNIIFLSLALKKKNQIFEEIIRITENYSDKNFLISPPSSGSNYLRGILSSYCEIYFKIGNGVPKFDSLTNKWVYSFTPVKRDTLFHHVNHQHMKEKFREKFLSDTEFKKKMIVFSRYPFIECDLFKIGNNKKVILIREPFSWIVSRYTQFEKNLFYKEGELNLKLINDELYRLNKFIKYWINQIKIKNNKFIILKFEELVNDPNTNVLKILNFYNYDTKDLQIIEKSIHINSKEFALKNLDVKFVGTRFTDPIIAEKKSEKIKDYCNEEIRRLNLMNNYKELISISKN